MGRTAQGAQVAALNSPVEALPTVDNTARVVYFPVRHHSPACAWHVRRLIEELRPESVLIEGPRDATPLVPLLAHPDTRMPVAIYTTYVRRRKDEPPERFAAYYPLCEFSPELVAVRAALAVGADVRFIDLTFPEKIEAESSLPDVPAIVQRRARSLQEESWFSHSRLLKAACVRSGARDPDDLWDHLYEVDYQQRETTDFMRNVLSYCALARRDATADQLVADGCLAREQAMAAAVAESKGRTLVVTGGFHTVALPETAPAMPRQIKLPPDDRQVVLMRYSFEQLDRLNGYASGMPSPEFYQRQWGGERSEKLIVEIARQCRRKNLGVSTADAIAAVQHARGLAELRGHGTPAREDVLDGIRSMFIKGSDDAEGIPVLAIARKHLAGDRVGDVPAEAGQPPIVHDFRFTAARLRLKLDKQDTTETTLDLYRKEAHREISRLFHRLKFLTVPFAEYVRGPDFVAGERLELLQEVWSYHWTPQTESSLIERSLYGATLEEAAAGLLMERFQEASAQGQGRSAGTATKLIVHACRMGLHRHTQDLLAKVAGLLAGDSAFDSLVAALENLLILEMSREPLEAHHLTGLDELAVTAYQRACFVLPTLVSTAPPEENAMLDSLNALFQAARGLPDAPELRDLRTGSLRALVATTGGSGALRGGAVGLLYGDGQCTDDEVRRHLRGHLLGSAADGVEGPEFLRGLLKTARNVLWQVDGVLDGINEVMHGWDENGFVKMLPLLRLALSELTPRETDLVAKRVASMLGAESLQATYLPDVDAGAMLLAVEINRRVRETLAADGLEALCE